MPLAWALSPCSQHATASGETPEGQHKEAHEGSTQDGMYGRAYGILLVHDGAFSLFTVSLQFRTLQYWSLQGVVLCVQRYRFQIDGTCDKEKDALAKCAAEAVGISACSEQASHLHALYWSWWALSVVVSSETAETPSQGRHVLQA